LRQEKPKFVSISKKSKKTTHQLFEFEIKIVHIKILIDETVYYRKLAVNLPPLFTHKIISHGL